MNRARGFDVSGWQPGGDFSKAYASGLRFVGVKATEGQTVLDKTLRAHRDGLRQQPFLLGIYYHFVRSGNPEKQAERFMDAVGPLRDNERVCCDFEVLPIPEHPADNLAWLDTFYETLMHGVCSDRRPLIYTSARIWRMLGNPEWDLASEIDLWAPRYSTTEPVMPAPWRNAGWTIWQNADDAPVPGVAGHCDVNYFRGDDAALAAYAKLTPAPPLVT